MKLIIRDDDLSYFADPKHLETIYGDVWDKIPINFSVVPKIDSHGVETPFMIEKNKQTKRFNPIGDNKTLIKFLKNKINQKHINIWQHGYTHQYTNSKAELENKNFNKLYTELKKGKDYLENIFNIKIDTLVAPRNLFSKQAILAAEKIGYKYICRGFAPLPREIQRTNKKYFQNFQTLIKHTIKYGKTFRYPYILDYGKHKEIYSYYPKHIDKNNIQKILELHKDGVLCITFHYRPFSLKDKEKLLYIINQYEKQKS